MLKLRDILKFIGNALKVDYIVEEGVSAGWTYRKWNSGIVELWTRRQRQLTHYSKDSLFYYYVDYIDLPFELMDLPQKVYVVQVGSGISMPCSGGLNDTKARVFYHTVSNVGGTSWITIQMTVTGRWK